MLEGEGLVRFGGANWQLARVNAVTHCMWAKQPAIYPLVSDHLRISPLTENDKSFIQSTSTARDNYTKAREI